MVPHATDPATSPTAPYPDRPAPQDRLDDLLHPTATRAVARPDGGEDPRRRDRRPDHHQRARHRPRLRRLHAQALQPARMSQTLGRVTTSGPPQRRHGPPHTVAVAQWSPERWLTPQRNSGSQPAQYAFKFPSRAESSAHVHASTWIVEGGVRPRRADQGSDEYAPEGHIHEAAIEVSSEGAQ